MLKCSSRQTVLEECVQAWLPAVLRRGLLHPQDSFAAAKLEGADVVMEPGLFVCQTPADPWFFDAGQSGERLAYEFARPRPASAEGEALGGAEWVPQRGADGLVDRALYAGTEVHLGQVAMVDVAGEEDHRGRGMFLRALARADSPQELREPGEGLVEGGPVLEVEDLADELAEPRRMAAPGALADGLVPRFEVVQTRGQEDREGGSEEEVVVVSCRLLLNPGPLVIVEHGAFAFVEHASSARIHHDQAHVPEVAVEAPAGARDLPVSFVGELAKGAGRVLCLPHPSEEIVLFELLRGEVAEVLVDPVRHERPDDALLPPRVGAHLAYPGLRGVPVVVDVVVVEDHRRRHGG